MTPSGRTETPYEAHVARWEKCERCRLCETRTTRVVMMRGTIPADVLVIGEWPSVIDCSLGKPFSGEPGYMIDDMLGRLLPAYEDETGREPPTFAFTNVIGCTVRSDDQAERERLYGEAAGYCEDRLEDQILLCEPSVIIAMGKLVGSRVEPLLKKMRWIGSYHTMTRPGAIVSADDDQRPLAEKRFLVAMATILASISGK